MKLNEHCRTDQPSSAIYDGKPTPAHQFTIVSWRAKKSSASIVYAHAQTWIVLGMRRANEMLGSDTFHIIGIIQMVGADTFYSSVSLWMCPYAVSRINLDIVFNITY